MKCRAAHGVHYSSADAGRRLLARENLTKDPREYIRAGIVSWDRRRRFTWTGALLVVLASLGRGIWQYLEAERLAGARRHAAAVEVCFRSVFAPK
jgi:hypothetical protein